MIENQIIHNDVIDGLKQIDSNSVSVVVTSPPYNVSLKYGNHNDHMPYSDYINWLKSIWTETYRVLKTGGRLIINIDSMVNHQSDREAKDENDICKEYFRPIYADLCRINKEIGYNFRCDIAWDKHQVVGRATSWGSYKSCSNPIVRRRHEYVLIWNKGPWKLEPSQEGIKSDLTDEEFQQWTMSYWFITPETRNLNGHVAPFPEELAKRLIKLYSYPNDIILDPFSGTGTTCYMASLLKRRYIGIDNDEKFVTYARNRISSQPDIFG